MIEAKPTKVVKEVQFAEAGEFDLLATFGFEANEAFASVTATVFIDILEVDGVGIGIVNSGPLDMVFSDDGDWLLSADGSGIPFRAEGTWTGSLAIDITALLLANNIEFKNGATKVNVTLDNRLTALSADGTSAFIAKKDFEGLTITATPEPSVQLLLGLGLAALLYSRRRA